MNDTRIPSFWESISIALLFNLAVSQPLYDLLSRNTEFFVARHSKPIDIILLTIVLSLLLPLILMLLLFMLGRISHNIMKIVYAGMLILLGALIFIPLLKRLEILNGFLTFPISLILSCMILLTVRRFRASRMFFKYLSVAIIAIPAVFLTNQSVIKILNSPPSLKFKAIEVSAKTPIIFLILDEFPLASLLNKNREIDAEHFPNFAIFQKDSLWFRNTTTVADETHKSIATILSGKYPDDSRLPILRDYPENLFTMLAGSYELRVIEPITRMCPENLNAVEERRQTSIERISSLLRDLSAVYLHIILPSDYAENLPSVKQTWNNFWDQTDSGNVLLRPGDPYPNRAAQFKSFLELIVPSKKPCLYFLHILLPHVPWEYLPSGKQYDYRGYGPMGVEGLSTGDETWMDDAFVLQRGYHRHLLQLGYVDRLIGELMDHLKKIDLYDRALIVVTADHGASFRRGYPFRSVTNNNYPDIVHVPLFVKLPGKTETVILDRHVETVDILPTIGEALGVNPGFKMDGISALREHDSLSRKKRIYKTIFNKNKGWLEYDSSLDAMYSSVDRKFQIFSTGGFEEVLKSKKYRAFIGLSPNDSVFNKIPNIVVKLKDEESFQNVDLDSNFIPAFIAGRVLFQQPPRGKVALGVWINRVFQGVTQTFPPDKKSTSWLKTLWLKPDSENGKAISNIENIHGFGIMIPESSFHQGKNEVQVVPLREFSNDLSVNDAQDQQ